MPGKPRTSPDDDGARLNVIDDIGIFVLSSNGNAGNGLNLSAGDDITIVAAEMNENGLAGVIASSDRNITVVNGSASRNMGGDGLQLRAGVEVDVSSAPPAFLAQLVTGADAYPLTTTNENSADGIDVESVDDARVGFPPFMFEEIGAT